MPWCRLLLRGGRKATVAGMNAEKMVLNPGCTLEPLKELFKMLIPESHSQRFWFNWSRVWPGCQKVWNLPYISLMCSSRLRISVLEERHFCSWFSYLHLLLSPLFLRVLSPWLLARAACARAQMGCACWSWQRIEVSSPGCVPLPCITGTQLHSPKLQPPLCHLVELIPTSWQHTAYKIHLEEECLK